MRFTFDGKCRSCGREYHLIFDLDEKPKADRFVQCPNCQNTLSDVDCERLYHAMDTLATFSNRNQLGNLKRVTIY